MFKAIGKFVSSVVTIAKKSVKAVTGFFGHVPAPVKAVGIGAAATTVAGSIMAQTNTPALPVDPSLIYTSLASPFNSALVWVIGAIAVLGVISWIRKAIRK